MSYRTSQYQQVHTLSLENNISKIDEVCQLRSVNKMKLEEFQNKLVRYFSIQFQKHEIKWPEISRKKQ